MTEKDIRARVEGRVSAAFARPDDTDTTSIWQTVYGDMMTNLMLFFLMMFSLSMVGKQHFEQAADAFKKTIAGKQEEIANPVKQAAERREEVNDFFRQFAETRKDVEVIEQGEGVRLRLPEPVLFDLGRADLKPEAKQMLHDFAVGIKKIHNAVVVEGHTDDVPISRGPYKSNWELSEARAENVVNYLVYEEGVPPERLAVAGFGEYWPFVPNDSDVSRALNRRIELLVIADEK